MRLREAAAAAGVMIAVALVAPGSAGAQDPSLPTVPIPADPLGTEAADFSGEPAKPQPLRAPRVPRHPFMAANGRSNLHVDAFQSDANRRSGPLGRDIEVSSTLFFRECASVAFDRAGRIVTICVGLEGPVLAILDPRTLETLAALRLPFRQLSGDNPFTDFAGGGYFYLDHRDRAVLPTMTGHLYVVRTSAGPGVELVRDVDLRPAVGDDAKVISALPDWEGRIWFASTGGVVGWVSRGARRIRAFRDLGERISNSFTVGPDGGVYVVTDAALYRLEARRGKVRTVWRRGYRNTGEQKSGQTSPGSGTTPTLLGRRFVTITDNADPLNVLVLRRSRDPRARRLVCRRPVLRGGAGSTDQSLVGIGRRIAIENNFGYEGPSATMFGGLTEPGLERVDLRRRLGRDPERNCRTAWRSSERAPSVVPKLSLRAGLLYTYTKPPTSDGSDPWYLTALDFRTGETVFKRLAGTGLGYNNNYAPVTIGPDGAAYVGVLGGLTRFADE